VPSDIVIRPLEDADWVDVHHLVCEVTDRGETYAMAVPADVEATKAFWAGEHLAVATLDGLVVAAARTGPIRAGQGSHVGTASFMVSEKARGRGVGRAMGEHVVRWFRTSGYRAVQLEAVVSTNTFAVRLWHSLGFRTVGLVPAAFRLPGGEYADLHVMHLSLVASDTHDPSEPGPLSRDERDHVLRAATRLFADLGWSGTTLAGVASEAGVPPAVVARFGTKADLLIAAFRLAGFGRDTDLQNAIGQLRLSGLDDVDSRLDAICDFAAETLDRMAPLVPPLNAAAADDPTAAAIRQGAELRRLGSSRALVGLLTRGEQAEPEAVGAFQVLTSGESYLAFRRIGWSPERYRAWLPGAIDQAVNGPAARR
jgi:AcrR family transcriptional regulator/GNAT superfamily N-acetyltransferase